ncbi:MAG: helix-turn-helix domain-containing protein [bacterium]
MRGDESPSRSARKAHTRERLKAAARACFAGRGYAETQISDIARTAGVAAGTLYVHFPSKEALLDELLDELDRELVASLEGAWRVDPARDASTALESRVRAVALACLEVWHTHRELLRSFAERATLGIDVRRIHDGVSPGAARWLTERLRTAAPLLGGSIPRAELVAQALLGLWLRVGLASLFDPSPPRAELAELLTRLSLGALQGVLEFPHRTASGGGAKRSRPRRPRR